MKAKLLQQVEFWHQSIALQLFQQCPGMALFELNTMTRRIVLALLWLVLCEQRGLAVSPALFQSGSPDRLYPQLLASLQSVGAQLGHPFPFVLPEQLPICDDRLRGLIDSLRASSTTRLPSNLLGQVYEQSLGWSIPDKAERAFPQNPLHKGVLHKKASGIYYTPEPIVDYVITQTIERMIQGLSPSPCPFPLILDPACGGGVFLLATYQCLLDWYRRSYLSTGVAHPGLQRGTEGQWQLTQAERSRILQAHIYGVDLDPGAVAVTQLSLWLKLLEDLPFPLQDPLPDLSSNIRWGDAVMQREGGFAWNQEFAEVLQQGGFDAVIGNPPYLDSEGMAIHLLACRQYCTQHYRSAKGNWDLFCVFIEKAIELCRTGGLVSLVVPNKIASADYARPVRAMLSQENQLLAIRDYGQVPVFAAAVYPVVFVMQRDSPLPHSRNSSEESPLQWRNLGEKRDNPASTSCLSSFLSKRLLTRYERMQTLHQVQQTRSIDLHANPSPHSWFLTPTAPQSALLARLQQDFPILGNIAQVRGAATVAEAYQLQSLIQDLPVLEPGDLQLVNSGTIDRYQLLWGKKPLRYLGQIYQHPVIPKSRCAELPPKRYQQAQQSKLIVAGMTQRLECAFDATGSVLAGKSTSIVWVEGGASEPDGRIDLRYLLGVLNSSLLSFYFSHTFHGNRLQGGYFRVGPPQLRSLPISLPDLNCISDRRNYDQMIEWVEQMGTDSPPKDEAIDQLVCDFYRLTDAERAELNAQPYLEI